MRSKLEHLLATITPERTYNETARRADDALNAFLAPGALLDRWDVFQSCMAQFYRHVENTVLRIHSGFQGQFDMDWNCCIKILQHIYGHNGEKTAFEIAHTGNEGGLYSVFRTVAERMADEYVENEIRARIGTWWNDLNLNEKFTAIDEYLANYGHLLPTELTEGSAARLKVHFEETLFNHVRMLRQLEKTNVG